MFDAVIVGGGPAGLSAGIVLGRQKRNVLLVDGQKPRNRFAAEMHMYLGRDGTNPADLLEVGRGEVDGYGVERTSGLVTNATGEAGAFELTLTEERTIQTRTILLATGVVDHVFDIPGLQDRWGSSVFHCPFCHGYENDGRTIAVIANGDETVVAAYLADRYSPDVVVCTNGPADLSDDVAGMLTARNVSIIETELTEVDGKLDDLVVTFADGDTLERQAIFHPAPTEPSTGLAAQLGCELYDDGGVQVNEFQRTTVPGVYAAGDIARQAALAKPVTLVSVGAGAGVQAAVWIEQELFAASFAKPGEDEA